MPHLEVDTVAEAIVEQVLSGKSGQVIKPGFGVLATFLRGFPHWYQIRTRNSGQKLMKDWNGRQVVDVEKHYELKESDSTILVGEDDN